MLVSQNLCGTHFPNFRIWDGVSKRQGTFKEKWQQKENLYSELGKDNRNSLET